MKLVCPVCGNEFKRSPCLVKNVKTPTCSMNCYNKRKFGEGNPKWRGGRITMNDGRVLIYAPDHPDARALGGTHILEYRLVAEQKLQRRLAENEIVHHINGDVTDNSPGNLEILTQSDHARLHSATMGQRSKITQESADRIVSDARLLREIAADYGVSPGYISRIKKRGIRRPAYV